ncbi:MAG: hypothetical protein ABJE95_29025 [Byssovorax sp.]
MSGCDFEAVEALAFGELTPLLADAVSAHVVGCPACAKELELLRAERGVFVERAKASPPLPGFSAALARSRWSRPEVVVAKAAPIAAPRRFPWAFSAIGVAAAAAFAGLYLLPSTTVALIDPPAAAPVVAEPATGDFCHDESFTTGITTPPKVPVVCEMPSPAADPEPCDKGCTGEEIDTGNNDSRVTEACYPPLPR